MEGKMPTNVTFSTVVGKTGSFTTRKFTQELMNTTAIDLAFQSRARWNYAQKQSFINSCLIDLNISKFILVDVERCYTNAVEKSDKQYYKGWLDKEVKYLIVDSNNRITTLKEFIAGKVKIPYGDYYIADKDMVFNVDKTNCTYKTMDKDFKALFLANTLSTHIVYSATREQLSDLFERMNSGESLNIYEKLNCTYSVTCEQIRKITDKMTKDFDDAKLFSISEIDRRKIDGWFANVFYLYVNGINQSFGKAVHKKWYSADSVSNKLVEAFVKDWGDYKKLVDKKLKLFLHKWVYFDLFYQITEQKKLGKVLKDKNIVQDFIDMYAILAGDNTAKYYFDDKYIEDVTVKYQFTHLVRGEGGNTPVRFKAYKDAGWDITKYFSGELDKKRTLSRVEKMAVAVRDNWKDSDGDEFVPEELFDGNLDAGHIVAYSKEGKTTLDNSVIEKMGPNRGKGAETTKVVNS
jgi:hypothetical protein